MKKIELSEDFFPEQEQERTGTTLPSAAGATVDRETVAVILGKRPMKPRPRGRPSKTKGRQGAPEAESPFVLIATLPLVLTRNMIALTASMFRAGLPTINSRRR